MRVGRRILRVVQRRIGVKQGYTLFPRLFSLYIKDIEKYLKQKKAPSVKLPTTNIILVLFAVDNLRSTCLKNSKEL